MGFYMDLNHGQKLCSWYSVITKFLCFCQISTEMKAINDSLHKQIDLDEYTKRLTNTKKRVNSVLATILAIEVSLFL
jgi:hypothetical protein